MSAATAATLPTDPKALIRSPRYHVLLVLAALVGLIVSCASWLFLETVHEIETEVYETLPHDLGYEHVPIWWPLPWLALAGLLTAFAIVRLPGHGGHVPADGLKAGGTPLGPIDLPGVLLAALATLGLGLVLGPEAPLLALGSGLGILAMSLVRRDAPQQALSLMAAAGSFAALASIFGSPVIGAVLVIEAAGLGGAMLSVVLLPGLMAAGIGSLVFIGLGSWSGFSTAAWSLSPFPLPAYGGPGWGDFGWTVVLAVAVAVATFAVMELARLVYRVVQRRTFVLTIVAGLAVGGLAIAFAETTVYEPEAVLFSGESAFATLFASAGDDLALRARAPDRLQGTGLEHLVEQLPRRPDVPGDLPRRRRRTARGAPPRLLGDARRRGPRRGELRLRPAPAACLGADRVAPLDQSRARRRAARRHRRGRRLPRERSADRIRRRTYRHDARSGRRPLSGHTRRR